MLPCHPHGKIFYNKLLRKYNSKQWRTCFIWGRHWMRLNFFVEDWGMKGFLRKVLAWDNCAHTVCDNFSCTVDVFHYYGLRSIIFFEYYLWSYCIVCDMYRLVHLFKCEPIVDLINVLNRCSNGHRWLYFLRVCWYYFLYCINRMSLHKSYNNIFYPYLKL